MSREFDLCKIVKIGLSALKRARVPLYRSKYSRGTTSGFLYLLQPGDMPAYYTDSAGAVCGKYSKNASDDWSYVQNPKDNKVKENSTQKHNFKRDKK